MATVWNPPTATDEQISAVLNDNAGMAGVDRARLSRLLCEQLAFAISMRALDSFAVTVVLQALEGHGPQAGRVQPRPFRRAPLRGLLHVHFVDASFIAHNLRIELEQPATRSRIQRVVHQAGSDLPHDEAMTLLAHELTTGSYEQRAARDALTGEWIIYAEHEGQKLYLGLARHSRDRVGDQAIYELLLERCDGHFREAVLALTAS
jgi:hypothetical protein